MAIFVWLFIKCKTLVTERKDPLGIFTNICHSLYVFVYMSWKLLGHCDTLRSNIPGCLMHLLLSLLILREYVAIFNQFCCFRPFRRCKTWYQITLQRASPWNRLCGRDRMSKFSFTPISGKIFDFAKKRISKENISPTLLSFIIKQKEGFFSRHFSKNI